MSRLEPDGTSLHSESVWTVMFMLSSHVHVIQSDRTCQVKHLITKVKVYSLTASGQVAGPSQHWHFYSILCSKPHFSGIRGWPQANLFVFYVGTASNYSSSSPHTCISPACLALCSSFGRMLLHVKKHQKMLPTELEGICTKVWHNIPKTGRTNLVAVFWRSLDANHLESSLEFLKFWLALSAQPSAAASSIHFSSPTLNITAANRYFTMHLHL